MLETAIQRMVKILDAEVGYTEKPDGYTKFGEWYTGNVDDSYDFTNAAWCDMFLAWGARQAGLQDVYGQFAYTPAHAGWFKEQGAWGTKPAPGALVFYDWSGGDSIDGIDHVGIVTKVDGDRIETIEGNVDRQFAKRKERDQSSVVGYGYPAKVKTSTTPSPPAAAPAPPATPDQGAAPQKGAVLGQGAASAPPTTSGPSAALALSTGPGQGVAVPGTVQGVSAAALHDAAAAAVLIPALTIILVLAAFVKRRWVTPQGRHAAAL
ncbi:CHAP domain-containing protein [Nonomuraea sp. NPDC050556]|uniref:CHAP domain-containing protein n=1 Tax=Nonomuraea sp. NPDC050556 TaxID=3364369 RepID=UPI00379F6319